MPATRTIREAHTRYLNRRIDDVLARRAQLLATYDDVEVRITADAVEFIVPIAAANLAHLRAAIDGTARAEWTRDTALPFDADAPQPEDAAAAHAARLAHRTAEVEPA